MDTPSPAIPSPWSVYTYGVIAYLEGTDISEGRGTYNPFTAFGTPFIEPRGSVKGSIERRA